MAIASSSPSFPIRVALCGFGAWGRNLARALDRTEGIALEWICDREIEKLGDEAAKYPHARRHANYAEVLPGPAQAIVIATPSSEHYTMALAALRAGKHVFLEKPMAMSANEAKELSDLAKSRNLTLMVGHLLLYHPGVELMKERIASGELGEIYYMQTQRVNLGVVRKDENALWSLAPHDFSVILDLFGEEPESVSARGRAFLQPGIEDVVFVNLQFASGKMAEVHVSWLDPRKERRMVVVGSRKMIEFDDMQPAEKIRIYDKGAEIERVADMIGAIRVRHGDVHVPLLPNVEPLMAEMRHFAHCVRTGLTPKTDGDSGARVVRLLELASESLKRNGESVKV